MESDQENSKTNLVTGRFVSEKKKEDLTSSIPILKNFVAYTKTASVPKMNLTHGSACLTNFVIFPESIKISEKIEGIAKITEASSSLSGDTKTFSLYPTKSKSDFKALSPVKRLNKTEAGSSFPKSSIDIGERENFQRCLQMFTLQNIKKKTEINSYF